MNIFLVSEKSVTIGCVVAIVTVLIGGIIGIHNWGGSSTVSSYSFKKSGGFFTLIDDYPVLTIFAHKTILNGKNPMPLTAPNGIQDGYYYINTFDSKGRDYVGQVPPEVFEKMYIRGYDISLYSAEKLVEIFKDIRNLTETIHNKEIEHVDEKYLQQKIDFANKQLNYL